MLPLIGSKEGIAHLPLAVLDPGGISIVPDPCYPPYRSGTIFAGGSVHSVPLLEENGFLPDLESVPADVRKRAGILYLNYPNNPTSAVCDLSFFSRAAEFAASNNIIVCHDAAYSELSYDGLKCPSFLQGEGAKETGVEFHSLSGHHDFRHMVQWFPASLVDPHLDLRWIMTLS